MSFKVSDKEYVCGSIDAVTQLYIARRVANTFYQISVEGKPLIEAFAVIPQDDFEYVTDKVLSYINRKEADKWAKIYIPESKLMLYPDISGGDIFEILIEVLPDILKSFFDSIGRMS